jgi:hypothetical protein
VLATPEQLTRIFDLDLWRPTQPGEDEQFDADRFGVWLEVLAEAGVDRAAHKLSEMDADLVIAGLAQHARVLDSSVVTPYRTTDGVEMTSIGEPGPGLECEIGGYRLVAKRNDSWDAIVSILIALDSEHPDYFHRVMRGCRSLSNSGFELDELHDLLDEKDQSMFDVSLDREQRRDEQGYVAPAQARAFLEMSRSSQAGHVYPTLPKAPQGNERIELVPSEDHEQGTAAFVDVLLEAGIIEQRPRALLRGSQDNTAFRNIRTRMQFALDRDRDAYTRRYEELTFIANTLVSGCSLQGRPFTAKEAWEAAVAVCNLGLENGETLPDDFLVDHDLLAVFRVGWRTLHKDVVMYTAEGLLQVLAGLRCDDYDTQIGLNALRVELSRGCATGTPWRARLALDVIAILDMPAWTALLNLLDECPVLPAVVIASNNPRIRSVSASAFEFISENNQIRLIREFVQSLPRILAN